MTIFNYFENLRLTLDQKNALEKVHYFLSNEVPVFILKGYAGTGKTTLIKGITDFLQENGKTVDLMAPTGRAAMVLSEKSDYHARTIHKSIYSLKSFSSLVNDKEESYKVTFKIKTLETIPTTIIVDEASLVSDKLNEMEFYQFGSGKILTDLIEYSKVKTNSHNKIIFIGDGAQLPPVDMNLSPALSSEYLFDHFNLKSQSYTIKEVVRQLDGSGILKSATSIRKSIENNKFNEFELDTSLGDITSIKENELLLNYPDESSDSIIITHSNKQALKYNNIIRKEKLGLMEIIEPEDILINTKNVYNTNFVLFNGMFVKVKEVENQIEEKEISFYISGGRIIREVLRFVNVAISINSGSDSGVHKVKILYDFINSEEAKLHPHKQRALYIDFVMRCEKKGIKRGSEEFSELIIKDEYFNALQLKYGYAITCHKAQGGEWISAFIDFNVFMGIQSKFFYRWAYTSLTRASNKVFEINAPKYSPLSSFYIATITQIVRPLPNHFYYPRNDFQNNFIAWHIDKVKNISEPQEIICETNTAVNYQLRYHFKKENKTCNLFLGYNKNFFNGQIDVLSSNDDEFKEFILELIDESFIPIEYDYKPKFDFQVLLNEYIIELSRENEIDIVNIHQNEWSEIYFFKTQSKCAGIEFFFNKKGLYTYASPFSMLGSEDEALNILINKLKGE